MRVFFSPLAECLFFLAIREKPKNQNAHLPTRKLYDFFLLGRRIFTSREQALEG